MLCCDATVVARTLDIRSLCIEPFLALETSFRPSVWKSAMSVASVTVFYLDQLQGMGGHEEFFPYF